MLRNNSQEQNHVEDWFELAQAISDTLDRVADQATQEVKTSNWESNAVAVRVLLRSCGMLRGTIVLTRQGLVAEGRTLARSLVESSFCLAALIKNPTKFIEMLMNDSEASRKRQVNFIIDEGLSDHETDLNTFRKVVGQIQAARPMNIKSVAALGPFLGQYLNYVRLSDDSVHVSARSLNRHVKLNAEKSGWNYRRDNGSPEENAATLHKAVLAGLSIGIAITDMLQMPLNNHTFALLAERFENLPSVDLV